MLDVTLPNGEFVVTIAPQVVAIVETNTQGLPGPRGRDGSGVYLHTQITASNAWVVNHNLSRDPLSVTTANADSEEIQGDVTFNSPETLTITFAIAVQGTAYCV